MKDKVLIELIVVLALVGFGLWSIYKNPVSITDTGQSLNFGIDDGTGTSGTKTKSTTPVIAPLSYTEALQKYKTNRLELNQDCRANPINSTYKNNTSIMVDNRSNKTRTVKVGSVFSIEPYGFKIVKLSSGNLPDTWYVDCDGSQNVSTVLIQK